MTKNNSENDDIEMNDKAFAQQKYQYYYSHNNPVNNFARAQHGGGTCDSSMLCPSHTVRMLAICAIRM